MNYLIITIFIKITFSTSRLNVKEMIFRLNEKTRESSHTSPNYRMTSSGNHKSNFEAATGLNRTYNSSEFVNSSQFLETEERLTVKQPTLKDLENNETLTLCQSYEMKLDLTSTLETVEYKSLTLSQQDEPDVEKNLNDTILESSESSIVIHDSRLEVKESIVIRSDESIILLPPNQKENYGCISKTDDNKSSKIIQPTTSLLLGQSEESNDTLKSENNPNIISTEPAGHFTLRLREKKILKTKDNQNIESCETFRSCTEKDNLQNSQMVKPFLDLSSCNSLGSEHKEVSNNFKSKYESTISFPSNSNNFDYRLSLTESDTIVLDEALKELCANLERLINNQQTLINDTKRVSIDLELLLTLQKISSDPLKLESSDSKDDSISLKPVSDNSENFTKPLKVKTDTSESRTKKLKAKNSNCKDMPDFSNVESDNQYAVSDNQQTSIGQVSTAEHSQFIKFENDTGDLNKFFETVILINDPSTNAPSTSSPEKILNQSEKDKMITKKVDFINVAEKMPSIVYSEAIQSQEDESLNIIGASNDLRFNSRQKYKQVSFPITELNEVKQGGKTSTTKKSKLSCCRCLFPRRTKVPDEDEPVFYNERLIN